jgi:hypothetical protein
LELAAMSVGKVGGVTSAGPLAVTALVVEFRVVDVAEDPSTALIVQIPETENVIEPLAVIGVVPLLPPPPPQFHQLELPGG